jgi:DNA polymerase III delta subunit
LGGDRSVVRGEVEKLALLAGAGGRIDLVNGT